MHPWLWQNPPISTYGTLLVLGFVAAWLWSRRRARAAGVDVSRIDLMMPVVLAAGIGGAWLAGVLTDALTALPVRSSVLAGGLLAGTAAGILYARWAGILLGVLGDIVAPPVALGVGIGRIGCFMAGCCFGKVCPDGAVGFVGVRFPEGSFAAAAQGIAGVSLPVYPVQLFESGLCVLLAAGLALWRARDECGVTGQKFLALGVCYGALRFGLELLRADNPPLGLFTFSQWAALGIVLLAGVTWVARIMQADRWHIRRPLDAIDVSPRGPAAKSALAGAT